MSEFSKLSDDLHDCLGALNKPRRVPVSQGAAETLILADAGGYTGPWTPESVPYLVKPMDTLASRHYESVCFVGPARTGKTAGLILGWLAHALTNDIGRMMIMHMTEKKAALLSKLDVEPAIDASPALRALRSHRAHDNAIHLKVFKHGMAVRFAHPSPSEMAATTYRYVALTDYDRFPTHSGLGGEIYDTAHKRTETLMSRRMTLVESSPERNIEDPHWTAVTPHEAPPCSGILSIYNRGDRHRWHWPCPECGEYFEAKPGLELFAAMPAFDELLDMIRGADIGELTQEYAHVVCPHCGSQIEHKHKQAMNTAGVWAAEGQSVNRKGEVTGKPISSTIASFWLGGVAAAYQSWSGIVGKYLQGVRQYALTGSEQGLESSTYTDQAMPYLPRYMLDGKDSIGPQKVSMTRYVVPEWARFLVATIDVQAGKRAGFVVQVHAVGVDLEQAIVDRYTLTTSETSERRLDPAAYPEDWDVLTDRVVKSTYKIDKERELKVFAVGVDTGGEKGVTPQAYAWWQRLRREGLAEHVYLLKGSSGNQRYPVVAAQGRDARGRKVPAIRLYTIATNHFKDMIAASIRRPLPGPTYMHFPDWLPDTFFDELKAETRGSDGKWRKIRESAPNEALDLWVYVLAVCYILGPANNQKAFNWASPPAWALPLSDDNKMIMTPDNRRAMKRKVTPNPQPQTTGFGSDEWAL